MNTLKAIQTSSLPRNPSFFHARKPVNIRRSTVTHCNSNGKASDSPPPTEGDKQKQELLAQIAMLQAQKVRLTDFLDERSAYLTQFAEDANAEFDEIAENARKELDEAGARIMENLENKMQSFEETAEQNRQEIEDNEKILEDFEDQIERDRNEGLFFKNLRKNKPPKQMEAAKEEARKLKELTRESAGSKVRRNIYLGLISLLTVAIVQAIVSSPEVEWRKVIALALIALALLAQFISYQLLVNKTLVMPLSLLIQKRGDCDSQPLTDLYLLISCSMEFQTERCVHNIRCSSRYRFPPAPIGTTQFVAKWK